MTALKKFASQADPALLDELRNLARAEGRQFQALVNEAFADLVEKRKHGRARPHVMNVYQASHEQYASLYRKLAE